jgi:hypothetical protein
VYIRRITVIGVAINNKRSPVARPELAGAKTKATIATHERGLALLVHQEGLGASLEDLLRSKCLACPHGNGQAWQQPNVTIRKSQVAFNGCPAGYWTLDKETH